MCVAGEFNLPRLIYMEMISYSPTSICPDTQTSYRSPHNNHKTATSFTRKKKLRVTLHRIDYVSVSNELFYSHENVNISSIILFAYSPPIILPTIEYSITKFIDSETNYVTYDPKTLLWRYLFLRLSNNQIVTSRQPLTHPKFKSTGYYSGYR